MESSTVATNLDPLEFRHTELDRERPSIRLVEILPNLSNRSLIQCRVSHHILPLKAKNGEQSSPSGKQPIIDDGNDLPSYRCLSYAWGVPQDPFVILMNGKIFWIRQNLHDFLAIARETISNTYLWIDALCIDQSNTSERNHQVQQMGRIYSNAETVLVWLGANYQVAAVLQTVNEAAFESSPDAYSDLRRSVPLWKSRPMIDLERRSFQARPIAPSTTSWRNSYFSDILSDSTGKAEKFFEPFITNDYWSRAWVTQEVLLAQRTVVLAGIEAHGLIALAKTYRSAVHFHSDSAFENIVDVIFRKEDRDTEDNPFGQGLDNWSLVNLLHRFRYKECAIRRDRVYSLLALSKEGQTLDVDYDIPEEQLMRQVLSVRESSICLCSTAIVAHALAPWKFDTVDHEIETPFAQIHMYASGLVPTGCPFCSNWVPSSWKKMSGRVFCLGTACPDTQGHIFFEHIGRKDAPDTANPDVHQPQTSDLIHLQLRSNNKSQLLCKEGTGVSVTPSEWKHVYLLHFSLRKLIEVLLHDPETGDMGLNACGNLWPSKTNQGTAAEGRLRLCDEQKRIVPGQST